jgi:hypothetical protein
MLTRMTVRGAAVLALLFAGTGGCSETAVSPLAQGGSITPPSSRPIATTPADGAANVSPKPAIHVTYQDALDPATVSTATVSLADVTTATADVPVSVTLDANAHGFSVTPAVALLASAHRYEVHIAGRPGVRFAAGRDVDDFRFRFTVSPDPTFTTASDGLPDAIDRFSYFAKLRTAGGSGGITFAITSGALPTGLDFDEATGEIFGTPTGFTATEVVSFGVSATDAFGRSCARTFSITVAPTVEPPVIDFAVTTGGFEAAKDTAPFDAPIVVRRGLPPFEVQVVSGALPPGVTIADNSTDQPRLQGVWDASGVGADSATFILHVTDALGQDSTSDPTFSVTLSPVAEVRASSGSTTVLKDAVRLAAYSESLAIVGPLAPFTFVSSDYATNFGNPVSTITFNSGTLAFSGTPTLTRAPTAVSFTFRDAANRQFTGHFFAQCLTDANLRLSAPSELTLDSDTSVKSIPDANVGVAYPPSGGNYDIVPQGGTPPYQLAVNGSFPTSVSAAVTNGGAGTAKVRISGTPSAAGQRTRFTISVVDAANAVASQQYDIRTITADPQVTTTSPLPAGKAGASYAQSFSVSGGTAPFSWSVISGTKPSGLALSAAGTLSGTPTAADAEAGESGDFSFTVRVTDSLTPRATGETLARPRTASKAFTMNVKLSYSLNIYASRLLSRVRRGLRVRAQQHSLRPVQQRVSPDRPHQHRHLLVLDRTDLHREREREHELCLPEVHGQRAQLRLLHEWRRTDGLVHGDGRDLFAASRALDQLRHRRKRLREDLTP